MKTMKTYIVMLAAALMPFALTSCDPDDGWDYYDYYGGWYDSYDWYDDPFDYGTAEMIEMARTVNGEWGGMITVADNNGTYSYGADFGFYQYRANSLNGNGVEYRYEVLPDGTYDKTSPLGKWRFTWYIDPRSRNLYLKYEGGQTYVIRYADLSLDAVAFDATMRGVNVNERDDLSLDRYTRSMTSADAKVCTMKMGKKTKAK